MKTVAGSSLVLLAAGGISLSFLVSRRAWLHAIVVAVLCVFALVLTQFAKAKAAAQRKARSYYLQRRRFELDADFGFCAPASELPKEYYAWELLASELAQLNRSGGLADYVAHHVPQLQLSHILALRDHHHRQAALHRAYIILASVAQSLCHGHDAHWELLDYGSRSHSIVPELPPQVSEPYLEICLELDLPPGSITAAATDLWNWGALRCSMTGTQTEMAFHALARNILLRAAPELPALLELPDQAEAHNYSSLISTLKKLAKMLVDQRDIFDKEHTAIDPTIFYEVYRPLLAGTSAQRPMRLRLNDNSLHEVHAKGPSAGQSTLFLLLDACLLDFKDKHNQPSPHYTFQQEMLTYMPPAHRALVLDFCPRAQQAMSLCVHASPRVRRAQLQARKALADFRRFHFSIATRFLRARGASTGTGGSDFLHMLNDAIHRSSSPETKNSPAATRSTTPSSF